MDINQVKAALGAQLVKTNVECPGCGAKLCNFCAGNGQCEDCGKRLSADVCKAIKLAVLAAPTSVGMTPNPLLVALSDV